MLEHGPIDVIALAFGSPRVEGRILAELERRTGDDTIRVLDAMLLIRDDDGACWTVDMEDLPDAQKSALGFIETGTRGLFDSDDSDALFEGMVPGSAILALAIEHVWAVGLVNAVVDAGADVALQFRVPAVVVDEAFAALASAGRS